MQNVGTSSLSQLQLPSFATPISIESNTCSTALVPQQTCTVTVSYAAGVSSDSLDMVFDYFNGQSPANAIATLNYIGSNPGFAIVNASPASVSLSTSNILQTVILTNNGTAEATSLTSVPPSAPLQTLSSTCGSTLAVGQSCSYNVYVPYDTSPITGGAQTVSYTYNNGTTASTAITAVDWITAVRYAYVLNRYQGISKCQLADNGDFTSCTVQPNWISAYDMTIGNVNGNRYLYLAISNDGLGKCTLDQYGDISSCEPFTYSSSNYQALACAYDPRPDPNDCTLSGEINYLTLGVVNGVQYMYLSDAYQNNLFTCTLNSNGDLNSCVMKEMYNITDISFINQNGTPYLYVNGSTDGSAKGTIQFALDPESGQPTTSLMSFTNTADPSGGTGVEVQEPLHVIGIESSYYEYTKYLYYQGPYEFVGNVSAFSFSGSTLNNSPISNFELPPQNGLNPYTINSSLAADGNNYLYISMRNGDPSGLYKCPLNSQNGEFGDCNVLSQTSNQSIFASAFASSLVPLTLHRK